MPTLTQTLLAPALLLAITAGFAMAAEAAEAGPAPQVAALQAALGSDNATAKKEAIRALSDKSVGKDEEVLALLVSAISDRQAGEAAVSALSSRMGKTPVGGSYRTGIDTAKIQAAWQKAYDDWKKTQDIKKLEKKVEKNAEKIKAVATVAEVKPSGEKTLPTAPAEDLGKMDRVNFVAGGSLLCFVMSKRTDADGKLVSVRVVHPDGAGEETIAAELISRIDEDLK